MDALMDPGVTPSHTWVPLVEFVLICKATLTGSAKAQASIIETTALFILTTCTLVCACTPCGLQEGSIGDKARSENTEVTTTAIWEDGRDRSHI